MTPDDLAYLNLRIEEPDDSPLELMPDRLPRRTLEAVKRMPCEGCGAKPGKSCTNVQKPYGYVRPHGWRYDAWVDAGMPA